MFYLFVGCNPIQTGIKILQGHKTCELLHYNIIYFVYNTSIIGCIYYYFNDSKK